MTKLPVIFRVCKSGDVTAVFPTLTERYGLVECYAHIGQHGTCSKEWYATTRPATEQEYASLLAELTNIYTTLPANNTETYGEPVQLVVRKRWPTNA